jgi:hypothetical protein
MSTGIRKMGARFWELCQNDIYIFGGGVITIVVTLLLLAHNSITVAVIVGGIVGWIWLSICMGIFWNMGLAPFSWPISETLKLAMVVLAPLTTFGILIGCLVGIVGVPFFMWHDSQKRYRRELRLIEEDHENIQAYKPSLRHYLIGGCIYYLVLAGVLFGIWTAFQPS